MLNSKIGEVVRRSGCRFESGMTLFVVEKEVCFGGHYWNFQEAMAGGDFGRCISGRTDGTA